MGTLTFWQVLASGIIIGCFIGALIMAFVALSMAK
jgi:hypothetical protein